MRYLGIGEYNDLGALYLGLATQGHEVRVFVEHEASRDVYGGMLDFTADWQAELGWLRGADGEPGIVLFESAVRGETQDALRRDGFQPVSQSAASPVRPASRR